MTLEAYETEVAASHSNLLLNSSKKEKKNKKEKDQVEAQSKSL